MVTAVCGPSLFPFILIVLVTSWCRVHYGNTTALCDWKDIIEIIVMLCLWILFNSDDTQWYNYEQIKISPHTKWEILLKNGAQMSENVLPHADLQFKLKCNYKWSKSSIILKSASRHAIRKGKHGLLVLPCGEHIHSEYHRNSFISKSAASLNPQWKYQGETKAKGPAKAKTAEHFTSAAGFTAKQIFSQAQFVTLLVLKKHLWQKITENSTFFLTDQILANRYNPDWSVKQYT